MDKKMNFKYFYGTEADQFSFYRIPKALFTNDCFKDLSSDAKILYGLMLDRMSLSIKNQWFDEENRAYIYFSIEDIMELLNCGRNKAVKSLQELDDEKGIAEAKKRVQELEKLICRIYEDNILGKLPDKRYAILDGQYSKEQKDLSAEIADMEAELSGYEEGRRSAEKFIALVDKYQNFDELTTYMLNEFVEKIVVHERDRKGSIETTQEVEIYFNFIGKYLPPHFGEVEMTLEEIEEMKKREARKDRLHQNYLKRKANGKQQEYYERTKAKKKAAMDAKKEGIRQEDIAKGVFVPVSLLPPTEPKKGVASA